MYSFFLIFVMFHTAKIKGSTEAPTKRGSPATSTRTNRLRSRAAASERSVLTLIHNLLMRYCVCCMLTLLVSRTQPGVEFRPHSRGYVNDRVNMSTPSTTVIRRGVENSGCLKVGVGEAAYTEGGGGGCR